MHLDQFLLKRVQHLASFLANHLAFMQLFSLPGLDLLLLLALGRQLNLQYLDGYLRRINLCSKVVYDNVKLVQLVLRLQKLRRAFIFRAGLVRNKLPDQVIQLRNGRLLRDLHNGHLAAEVSRVGCGRSPATCPRRNDALGNR